MELTAEHEFKIEGCTFIVRNDTTDEGVIRSVFEGEYEIPNAKDYVIGAVSADIGAHVGAYAIWAAKRRYPGIRVIAVEPIPENVRLVWLNVHRNGLDRYVNVMHGMVGGETSHGHIGYTPDDTDNGRQARFVGNAYNNPSSQTVLVPNFSLANILDQSMQSFGRRNIWTCKLDCEGGEVGLLQKAHKFDLGQVKHIVGEHHGDMESIRTALKDFVSLANPPNQNPGLFLFENPNLTIT